MEFAGAVKLKVEPGAAVVVVVAPKPPNVPGEEGKASTNETKKATERKVMQIKMDE